MEYNGRRINTKKELVLEIFNQAGINFVVSEKFWENFDRLD